MATRSAAPRLDRRALNRALLARQHLLQRSGTTDPAVMIDHLVGMQAQLPEDPYLGLWSRIADFDPASLSTLIEERRAVRIALLRSTIHLATTQDARVLRPLTVPVTMRMLPASTRRALAAAGAVALEAQARAIVDAEPRSTAELGRLLAARWPDHAATDLVIAARALLPLVQVPPRGLWGRSGTPTVTSLEAWTGQAVDPAPSVESVVLRYLRAFGPASSADIRTWSGIPGLRVVVERLRPTLRTFRDERDRELLDVPDGLLPDPGTPAPMRFLPVYDNVVLGHDDRSRIVPADVASALVPTQENIGSVLIDGFVGARWRLRRDRRSVVLSVEPVRPLAPDQRRELVAEAERALAFLARDATTQDLEVTGR